MQTPPDITGLAAVRRALDAHADVPPDTKRLTRALGQAVLEQYQNRADFPSEDARQLLELTYPADSKADTDNARNQLLVKIANQGPKARQEALTDFLARMGHVHQIASLMTREQLLALYPDSDPIDRLLYSSGGRSKSLNFPRMEDALKALHAPAMEFTFTAHPTNTNGVPFMRSQRALVQTLQAWHRGEATEAEVNEALERFAKTSLFPQSDGKVSPLTVQQETEYMLYFLRNAYDDLDAVYKEYDTALGNAYGGRYRPEDLALNIKFHSWGSSGDKDGNGNVNAETTLHAIAEHRFSVLVRYKMDLDAIQNPSPEIATWKNTITQAMTEVSACLTDIQNVTTRGAALSEAQFDALRDRLAKASVPLDANAFETALKHAHPDTINGDGARVLALLRHVRHFGFALGSIEYRETAEEYQRVIAELVPGYMDMDEAQKQATLSALLAPESKEKLQQAVEGLRARLVDIPGKPYSKTDALPIAYHTLKRMELARDFPDMLQNNVLAECQNTSNFLEALVLQRAVAQGDKQPKLGIIPLFEEYGVLEHAPEILNAALHNPAYQQHQKNLATMGDGREKQQVQLAHSDNARRAGSIGSRAAIYKAQDALQRMGIRRYQGGSQSDAYRDGVRAISGKINEFGLHDFAKMTFQGGDLLNYFNLPHSSTRLITRNLSASALALKEGKRHTIMTAEDRKVLPALMETIPGYEELFRDERFSDFVDAAGYTEQQRAGNFSSRASARTGAPAKVSVPNTRTISYSETLEHAGIVPIWIGAKGLRHSLANHLAGGGELTPSMLHHYYEKSPLFKDVVDRLLFSTARSSFSPLQRMNDHPLMQRLVAEYNEAYQVAMEAYTGKPVDALSLKTPSKHGHGSTGEERQLVIQEAFNHTQDFFADQDRFMRNVHAIRALWLPKDWDNYLSSATLHNMTDTVHHGRNWLIDDPGAAKLHCTAFNIERPYVSTGQNGHGMVGK